MSFIHISIFITSRFLASGDSMTSLSYQYLIGLTTVSNIIVETCEIIWHIVQPLVLTPPTEEKWREVANTFNEKWQFPHCLGALDGKHVMIQVSSFRFWCYFYSPHIIHIIMENFSQTDNSKR